MKTEGEVLEQIRQWARALDSVRAVILTSSRADPQRTPDTLSDYDLQVFMRSTDPITRDDAWLAPFGPVMVRWPLRPGPTFSSAWITQLVLFADGVRIDFQFTAGAERLADPYDPCYVILVDKDCLAGSWVASGGESPKIAPPTVEDFQETVNGFWWDIVYVAKGLARGEIPYARYMLDGSIRFEQLARLLSWYVGITKGWQTQIGIHGRWLHRALDAATWDEYVATCADASAAASWSALFATMALARKTGTAVALALGFDYPEQVDREVSAYIGSLAL
jgi:aminoglycoside 6-adenylyltransferase